MTVTAKHPISLPFHPVVAKPLEFITRIRRIRKLYDIHSDGTFNGLVDAVIKVFGFDYEVEGELKLPSEGPVVIVANQPIGGPEGLLLIKLLMEKRPDLKVITNQMLTQLAELKDITFGVKNESQGSTQNNESTIEEATKHIESGGALMIFPAGMTSRFNLKKFRIEDIEWNNDAASIVKRYNAACLPVYIHARNSHLFYIFGLIYKHLGTMMLPNELLNKRGKLFKVKYGDLIQPDELKDFDSVDEVNNYLRLNTELLGAKTSHSPSLNEQSPLTTPYPDQELIDTDLEGLKPFKLLEQNEFDIYCAPYNKMGSLMTCIGIAREIAFRAVGIGSGKDIDLDKYDHYYEHLFIWDNKDKCVVGSYRIGQVDKILEQHGVKGLYIRSLYRFKEKELKNIQNCLEVGRSFIHPNYQRHPASLSILWRGIGAYMEQHPEYHTLFGGACISREHSNSTRALIADVLLKISGVSNDQIGDRVKPIKPMRLRRKIWDEAMLKTLSSVSLINRVIGRSDYGKSIPILLRQYLALNGKIACFAVNPSLDNSLDALIIVDLRETPEKYLRRYFSSAYADEFARCWKLDWAKETTIETAPSH